MTFPSLADRLATVRTFAAGLKLYEDELRRQLDEQMAPGDRRIGFLPNGEKSGRITKSEAEVTASVTDADALAQWLAREYPDHVKPQAKEWALAEILAASKLAGAPVGPGGEMDIPGVTVGKSRPALKVYANQEMARFLAAELPAMVLDLALPGGE